MKKFEVILKKYICYSALREDQAAYLRYLAASWKHILRYDCFQKDAYLV